MPYLKQAANMVFLVNTQLIELVDKITKAIENHEFTVGIVPDLLSNFFFGNYSIKIDKRLPCE